MSIFSTADHSIYKHRLIGRYFAVLVVIIKLGASTRSTQLIPIAYKHIHIHDIVGIHLYRN